MPSVVLNKISEPKSLTDETGNSRPFSFSEWINRHTGVSFNDAEKQYQKYLNDFYKVSEKQINQTNSKLKEDYKNLLKRLQIIFQNDEEFERYKNIDLDSQTDLYLAIPFYAKKLKEIALFYSNKRKELQSKKIEYNLVGSFEGLSKILNNNLLFKFTKNQQNNFVSENPLITQSPEYSSIMKDFSIEVEELYDTTDYYSLEDNINPFACIFNDLCYSIFSTPLSAKADPLENYYLCDPSNETVDQLLQKAYEKYLSTDTLLISGGYFVEKNIQFDLPIQQGNNFFYWFSGQTAFDVPEGIYKDSPINSFDWTHASGSSSIQTSDLIFVNAGNFLTKAAWLQDTQYVSVKDTMSATITNGKLFRFPFPDYGTSAFGGEWSGPSINDTIVPNKKFFPTEEDYQETQNQIIKTYWNSFSSISTVKPILLQDTTLSEYATPSNKFKNADKIYVSEKTNDSGYYSGSKQVAWLYDFRKTQIPITNGENKIYFPLQRYDDDSQVFYNFFKNTSIKLSSLKVEECFSGSVAGLTVDESDLIIKNLTICGPELEAAWLKAVPLQNYSAKDQDKCNCDPSINSYFTDWNYISGGAQASVNFKCDPSNYVRFVWTGESTNINDVRGFSGFEHDDSCEYKRLDHSVSIIDKNFYNSSNPDIIEKWKKCTCGAIIHSPLGHNFQDFESLGIIPDFIVKDTGFPKDFYSKNWKGSDGKDYTQSKDCARFYPELIEKDIGWGKGQWKAQDGQIFVLEKGQSYIFYRSISNSCSFESPYFLLNHSYSSGTIPDENCISVSYYPKWFKAIKDEDGNWIDSGVETDMSLTFGDFLIYNHRENYSNVKRRLLFDGAEVHSVSGNYIYTLSSQASRISYETYTNTIPSVNFLITIPIQNSVYWGKANYEQDQETIYGQINDYGFNTVFDYLQITQPPPSEIVLNNNSVLEFSFSDCSSGCYVWQQELNFDVYSPVKKWNEILLDSCVKSDILDYLNKQITNCYTSQKVCENDCSYLEQCTCEYECSNKKSSLTATYQDSDIVFNTELSGSYVFVNYFARNSFTQTLSVVDITNGDKSLFVPVFSSEYIKPISPWRDLLNQKGSNFVVEEKVENLQTKEQINFYTPSRIGMNRFETHDSDSIFTANTTGFDVYRVDNYFDKPYNKKSSYSKYVTEFSLGQKQGTPDIKNRQTFTPYNNSNEKYSKEYYGLYDKDFYFSPWNKNSGEWNESDVFKNYRNQYNINCSNDWYSNQLSLTGDVYDWQTDIFGNHYFCVNNENLNYTINPSSYNTLFIKTQDGNVNTLQVSLSSIVDTYKNIYFDVT